MVYILMVALVVIIALVSFASYSGSRQGPLFRVIILLFVTSIVLYLLYLCKDPYYLGIFLEYIPLPRAIILQLYTLRLSRIAVLRLMNLNALAFMACNLVFALGLHEGLGKRLRRGVFIGAGCLFLAQALVYDPTVYSLLYGWLYPAVMDTAAVTRLFGAVTTATRVGNSLLLAGCVALVFGKVLRSPRIQMFRLTMMGLGISYAILMLSYLFFFNGLPTLLVKYSKVADIFTFQPLVAAGSMRYYQLFPYIVSVFLVPFAISFFRLSLLRRRMDENSLQIAQNIKAANLSSRLFCHYMKNEILAISAELKLLDAGEPDPEAIGNILKRCDQVYSKLDGIHQSMRDDSMDMRMVPVEQVVEALLAEMAPVIEEHGAAVQVDVEPPGIQVMVDPGFLEQALRNLVYNALEAMADSADRRLSISARQNARWVSLDVADTGCGIEKKDLDDIFTPLFSSKPMTRNWGIGLTMVHKVVSAFGGTVQVTSQPGQGTVFHLLLPAVQL